MSWFDWLRPAPADKAEELHRAVGKAGGEIMSHSDSSFSVSVGGKKPVRFHRTAKDYDRALAFVREGRKK